MSSSSVEAYLTMGFFRRNGTTTAFLAVVALARFGFLSLIVCIDQLFPSVVWCFPFVSSAAKKIVNVTVRRLPLLCSAFAKPGGSGPFRS